jgi:hypothetical protein
VRIGVLVTGDAAVRAAHSLEAHPGVDEVVVIGPAKSRSFDVVPDASGCDYLVGTGDGAPGKARAQGVSLIWDGERPEEGVAVFGASPQGLTLAMASREPDPRLVAVAHPALEAGNDHRAAFPVPVGRIGVADGTYAGRRLATGRSPNSYAACLALGASRNVTIIDHGAFMSGVALAAGVSVANGSPSPVWGEALVYLETATGMGLVMAEEE